MQRRTLITATASSVVSAVAALTIARAADAASRRAHVAVMGLGGRFHGQGDDQETPDTQIATFRFADGKVIAWEALSCQWNQPVGRQVLGDSGAMQFWSRQYEPDWQPAI